MKVGMIGLGSMGSGVAKNLVKKGFDLVVHDVRKSSADPLIAAGATWADSPFELAKQSDVIFTSVPGPPEFLQVAEGEKGLLAGMKPGTVHFDLSTNSPDVIRSMHEKYAAKSVHLLDAPVSGGPKGANSGTLAVWVGGDEAAYQRYKHVIDAFSDGPEYIGPIGSATVSKLVHNCVGAVIGFILVEAFTMGVKAGVDPLTVFKAVRNGAVGRRRTFDGLQRFLAQDFDPPAFALKLYQKDTALAVELGEKLGVPMRYAGLTLSDMNEAIARGWADRDARIAMRIQEEAAGVSLAIDPALLKKAMES